MTIEQVLSDLKAHEGRSQERYEELRSHITENQMEPTSVKNIFESMPMGGGGWGGAGAGAGAGLGAGLLGGVLGGALLGNGGLGGNRNGEGIVTPAMLTAGLAGVTDTLQNTTVVQTLGSIQAAIPLAEAQVQLALAGTTAQLQLALTTNADAAALANSLTNQNIASTTATVLAAQIGIKDAVTAYGVANLTATKDAQYATAVAISSSTKEILAALVEQNTANLQRQLTVAEQALLGSNFDARARGIEINTTNNINQMQQQQQQQQQFANLYGMIAGLNQSIRSTNEAINVGSGTLTASPTNTNTNIR